MSSNRRTYYWDQTDQLRQTASDILHRVSPPWLRLVETCRCPSKDNRRSIWARTRGDHGNCQRRCAGTRLSSVAEFQLIMISPQQVGAQNGAAAVAVSFDGGVAGCDQPLQAVSIHQGANGHRGFLGIDLSELLFLDSQLNDGSIAAMASRSEEHTSE